MKIKKKHLSYVANNIKEVHLKEKFLNMLATPSTNEKGYVTDSYEFFLNKNEKDLLIDELTSLLIGEGLDNMDNANSTGILIEEIIDLINEKT